MVIENVARIGGVHGVDPCVAQLSSKEIVPQLKSAQTKGRRRLHAANFTHDIDTKRTSPRSKRPQRVGVLAAATLIYTLGTRPGQG